MKYKTVIKYLALTNIVEYVAAIAIILECESVWMWDYTIDNKFKILLFALTFLTLGFLSVLNLARQGIKKSKAPVIIFATFFVAFFLLKNFDLKSIMFAGIFYIFIIYQMTIKDDNEIFNVFNRISDVLLVIACISLLFWFLGSVLGMIHSNEFITLYRNSDFYNVKGYFHLYYEGQKEATFGFDFVRNTGIFYEAPKYSLLLSITLAFEIYINKTRNLFKIIIFCITIITTLSVTGLIFLGLLFVSYMGVNYPKSKVFRMLKMLLILISVIGAAYYVWYLFQIKSSTVSYDARLDDYFAGFKAWLQYPVFGCGYSNMDTIRLYMSSFRENNLGFSNSVFRVLAQGGLFLFSAYFIPVYLVMKKSFKEHAPNILFFALAYIYLFVTTSFPYNYISVLIIAMFWRLAKLNIK